MSSDSLIATPQLSRLIGLLQARSCVARTRRLASSGSTICRNGASRRPLTATLLAGAPTAVVPTALIGIAALAVLFHWKVSNPLLFVGAAYFGLLPAAASARLSDE